MNRTEANKAQLVPLQTATDSWTNEPGYGGTVTAWEAFDAAISEGLKALEARHPGPAKMPTGRQSATTATEALPESDAA